MRVFSKPRSLLALAGLGVAIVCSYLAFNGLWIIAGTASEPDPRFGFQKPLASSLTYWLWPSAQFGFIAVAAAIVCLAASPPSSVVRKRSAIIITAVVSVWVVIAAYLWTAWSGPRY